MKKGRRTPPQQKFPCCLKRDSCPECPKVTTSRLYKRLNGRPINEVYAGIPVLESGEKDLPLFGAKYLEMQCQCVDDTLGFVSWDGPCLHEDRVYGTEGDRSCSRNLRLTTLDCRFRRGKMQRLPRWNCMLHPADAHTVANRNVQLFKITLQ